MPIFACMHARPTVKLPENLNNETQITLRRRRKEKVVVVVGATGTCKSRLSIDLATRFGGEVINSDKIQVYKGLDVIANKVATGDRRGVPHHLIGFVDLEDDFTVEDYVHHASVTVAAITCRGRLPIVAGGSVSFVKALVAGCADAYDLCFLWVDVEMRVLHFVLSRRVDEIVELGLVEEARGFYAPSGDYSRGIRQAVGVPEMHGFFRNEGVVDDRRRVEILKAAIDEIKASTHKLACCQVEKIMRLPEDLGVELLRLDATTVFEAADEDAAEEWEKVVLVPSTNFMSFPFEGEYE